MASKWDKYPEVKGDSKASKWEKYPEVLDTTKEEEISPLETAIMSGGSGATLGFLDELAAAGGSLVDVVKRSDKSLSDIPELYKRNKADFREAMGASATQNPGTAMGAELVGSLAPGLLVPGSGSSALTRLGAASGLGGLSGAGQSDAKSMSELSADVAGGALMGGLFQGGGELVGKGLSKAAEKAAKSEALKRLTGSAGGFFGTAADDLSARALGAQKSIIKNEGVNKIRAAGRQALDNDMLNTKLDTDDMIKLNEALLKEGGESMGKVYQTIDESGIKSGFNPLDVALDVEKESGDFYRTAINKDITKQFENTIESILSRGADDIPLQKAQELKSELDKVANWKKPFVNDPTDKEKMARDAVRIVKQRIDESTDQASKALNIPSLLEDLKQGRSKFGAASTTEKLLSNKQSMEQGNKIFGLTDTIVGVGGGLGGLYSGDESGGLTTAAAAIAAKKLGSKYGLKLAAQGVDKVSKMLKLAPEKLGKYAPALNNAAQRGNHSLAITHYILSKTQPDYQKSLEGINLEDEN